MFRIICKGCKDNSAVDVPAISRDESPKDTGVLQRMESPKGHFEAVLRRMEGPKGHFEAKSERDLEALLSSTQGEALQAVLSVDISFKPTRHHLLQLSRFPCLVDLNLQAIARDDFSSLIDKGVLPRSLTGLNLSCNQLRFAGATHLSQEGVLPPNLVRLDLQRNRLGVGGAKCLLRPHGALSRLTSLDLGKNDLHGDGKASLFQPGVFSAGLKCLNLHENMLGDTGVAALFKPGVLSKELVSLNLSQCLVSADGVKHLARASLPKLQDLSLAHNSINADGVAYLVAAHFMQTSLTTLDLYGCAIGPVGADHLIEKRASFEKLQTLNLCYNKIGESKVLDLEDAFSDHLTLKVVAGNMSRPSYNQYGLNTKDLGMD